jgi:hypothetical protein
MANTKGRFYNLQPTPDNFRALWDRVHALDDGVTGANATIQQQAATIAAQAALITSLQQGVQQALITAGKATSATSQGTAPGGGGTPPPTGDAHPNHQALIQQAKDELVALSEDLTGPCGAFKIVQRAVPWIQASDPAAGYLEKTSGNNCGGFATDIVCYNDGIIYDVLGAAGDGDGVTTGNDVQWNFAGTVDPSRYRATT